MFQLRFLKLFWAVRQLLSGDFEAAFLMEFRTVFRRYLAAVLAADFGMIFRVGFRC